LEFFCDFDTESKNIFGTTMNADKKAFIKEVKNVYDTDKHKKKIRAALYGKRNSTRIIVDLMKYELPSHLAKNQDESDDSRLSVI